MTNKHAWKVEYGTIKPNLSSTTTLKPSSFLVEFIESQQSDLRYDSALEIGCGKGRNIFYLAQKGFELVEGFDFIDDAISAAKAAAVELDLTTVNFQILDAGSPLPYQNDQFDLIIDIMVLHLLDANQRQVYSGEVNRILNTGGYFVIHTLAAEGEEFDKLIAENPGREERSYTIPQTGAVERAFTKEELVELLYPLQMVQLEIRENTTNFGGVNYTRSYLYGVFRKM